MAPATVRKYILALKTALLWLAKNSGFELNKFLFDFDAKTMPPAWGGQRDRRLIAGEETKLYLAGIARGEYTYCEGDWQALIGMELETAMHQQELAKATWSNIRSDGFLGAREDCA